MQEFGTWAGGFVSGSSNCVTPLPRLLMNFRDAAWMIGLSVFFEDLFNEDWKTSHDAHVEHVHEAIDMNAFLPTTFDNYRDWPTVAGHGFTGEV